MSGGLAGSWSRCSAAMRAALQDSASAGGASELRGSPRRGAVAGEAAPALSQPPVSMGLDMTCTESPTGGMDSSEALRAGPPTSSAGALVPGGFFPRLQKTSSAIAAASSRQPAMIPAVTGAIHASFPRLVDARLLEGTEAPLLTGTGVPTRGADAETAAGGEPLAAADATKKAANRDPGDAEPICAAPVLIALSFALNCGDREIPSAPLPLASPQAITDSVTTTDGDGADTLVSACVVVLAFSSKLQDEVRVLTALDGATSMSGGSPDASVSMVIMTRPTGSSSAQAMPRRRRMPMLGSTITDRAIPPTVTFRGTCRVPKLV